MIHIAILGFGVVGSGVAEVLSTNASELAARLDGEQLNIKHILDLRTFPEFCVRAVASEFLPHGSYDYLLGHCRLDAESLAEDAFVFVGKNTLIK